MSNGANILTEVPSYDEACEESCIGACLISYEAAELAVSELKPSDFYLPRYRTAFEVIRDLTAAGRNSDELIVLAECQRRDKDYDREILGRCIMRTPSAASIDGYIEEVRRHSLKRGLVFMAGRMLEDLKRDKKPEDVLSFIGKESDRIAARMAGGEAEPESLASLALRAIKTMPDRPKQLSGPRSGLDQLDWLVDGWEAGTHTVIAAPQSVGKTTLAQAIIFGFRAMNPDLGRPLIFTTENSPFSRAQIALASMAGIDTRAFKRGNVSKELKNRLEKMLQDGALEGVDVIQCAGWTVGRIRAVARRHARKHKLPMMIVDMPEHLDPENNGKRDEQLATISRGLFRLSRELNTAMICVAQVNRSGVHKLQGDKAREGEDLTMHDIKGTSQIEGDADKILILQRLDHLGKTNDPQTKVILGKDRAGAWAGKSIQMEYSREENRFKDLIP